MIRCVGSAWSLEIEGEKQMGRQTSEEKTPSTGQYTSLLFFSPCLKSHSGTLVSLTTHLTHLIGIIPSAPLVVFCHAAWLTLLSVRWLHHASPHIHVFLMPKSRCRCLHMSVCDDRSEMTRMAAFWNRMMHACPFFLLFFSVLSCEFDASISHLFNFHSFPSLPSVTLNCCTSALG